MKTAEAPNTIEAEFTKRETCRSCGYDRMFEVLNLGVQTLPRFTDRATDVVPRAPLELIQCAGCGLLQLQHTVNPDSLFREYWYRSSMNQSMKDALKDVALAAIEFAEGGTWLDIGANDGFLLSQVPDAWYKKVACEPALTFTDALKANCDSVIPDYFTAAATKNDGPYSVITSCAMFYDLEDPAQFVRDIASVLHKDGVWVNQLNDAPTMLAQNAFDAICHEHLTYWSLGQLADLYKRCGLKIVKVTTNDVNGGSVRVFAVHQKKHLPEVRPELLPNATRGEAIQFADRIHRWKEIMGSFLRDEANRHGPVWGYGASTKAGTLLQFLDEPYVFHAVADRNPLKHGKYMATRLNVVSEDDMRARGPRMVVPFIWAFRKEILERERDIRGLGATFLFPCPNPELVL
jgi:C-methyltransferase-like protein/methyltransferase family protein/putative zinc binding protein